MNRRIQAIADLIEEGTGVIDVGTDHGYLPIALAKRGYKGNILASDIKPEPLSCAMRNAAEEGADERISFFLSDGLKGCNPKLVDTIVIAGLGGDTICRIIDEAEWTMKRKYTLLLQPMSKGEVLRYFLLNNNYDIISETGVSEGGKRYCIIKARFCPFQKEVSKYSDAEIFAGRSPDREAVEAAIRYLENRPEKHYFGKIIEELRKMNG